MRVWFGSIMLQFRFRFSGIFKFFKLNDIQLSSWKITFWTMYVRGYQNYLCLACLEDVVELKNKRDLIIAPDLQRIPWAAKDRARALQSLSLFEESLPRRHQGSFAEPSPIQQAALCGAFPLLFRDLLGTKPCGVSIFGLGLCKKRSSAPPWRPPQLLRGVTVLPRLLCGAFANVLNNNKLLGSPKFILKYGYQKMR